MQHSSREPREVRKQSDDRWKAPEHREVVDELMDIPEAKKLLHHYGYLD